MYYIKCKFDMVDNGVLVAKKNTLYEVVNYKKGQYTFISEDNFKCIVSKGGKYGIEIVVGEDAICG